MSAAKLDCKPNVVAGYPVRRALNTRVLIGYGNAKTLPRLSKVQSIIIKKVAEEFGYLYPYIPAQLEEEIHDKETQWADEAVRNFLQIPLLVDYQKLSRMVADKYTSVLQTWSYDRKINSDSVVISWHNKKDIQYFITMVNAKGETLKLPDPRYYW